MSTEEMIFELRRLSELHKDDPVYTGDVNWSVLCRDVSDRLEELNKQLTGTEMSTWGGKDTFV